MRLKFLDLKYQNKNIEKPSKKIPEFNVFGGRSPKKIKVLGISV